MVKRAVIASVMFCIAAAVYILSSGGPYRVVVAVICSWATVSAFSFLAVFTPGIRKTKKLVIFLVVIMIGAWLVPFALTSVVLKAEMSSRMVMTYLFLELLVIGMFLGLTELAFRLLVRTKSYRADNSISCHEGHD